MIVWSYKKSPSELSIFWLEMYIHLLVMWDKTRKDIRWEKSHVKLLGVTIDINLSFDTHNSKFCSKTNRKLTALSRMSKFLSLEKRGRIIKDYMKEF